MLTLHRSSLRRTLISVIMLTVGLALVLAVGAFVGIEIYGYRTAQKRELTLLAQVVGESSSAALEFKEPSEAKRLLANLKVHRHIVSAAILDRDGRIFATYRRDSEGPVPEALGRPIDAQSFEQGHLCVTTPIRHAGELQGSIFLKMDMAELNRRLLWVLIASLVLTLLIGSTALLMAMRVGRIVSEPILHLTDAARTIASGKDSGVRVPRETEDEVGVLVDAFNVMLDQLEERQARLKEAQRLAHLGHWAFDPNQQYSDWSEETFRILGLDPARGVPDGETFRSLIYPEDLPSMDAAIARGLGSEGRFELDHRIVKQDGSIAWIHASGVKFTGPAGKPVLRGTIMDITDRKQSEAALLQGQKLESLGVLAGGIAHDFNNLLAALQGFLEMTRLDVEEHSPALAHIDRAERVIQRAADLVRQMLAYSGKASFHVAPMDLSVVVREMGHLLSVSISKKANLRYELAEGLPAMVGDVAQVQQVVMNLVINASDALAPEGGLIKIATRLEWLNAEHLSSTYAGQEMSPGSFLVLEVEDTGHGMDAATIARIFDPFFTTKFAGRGLGLAAMLGIVRAHKGGIKVYSEVGKGTSFKVLFPASAERRVQPRVTERERTMVGAGKVLVVDDEIDIRASASAMLERLGFEPLAARDGAEGLELVKQYLGSLKLVVLDYTMPVMDGEACFRAIHALDPNLPVLLTSGFGHGERTEALLREGLSDFLQKPYSLPQLQAAIQKALA
jgi:PAS domain S-box-containing protein